MLSDANFDARLGTTSQVKKELLRVSKLSERTRFLLETVLLGTPRLRTMKVENDKNQTQDERGQRNVPGGEGYHLMAVLIIIMKVAMITG